ncbi:Nuclear pore complex protein NUP62 [Chlorella vulgaris]
MFGGGGGFNLGGSSAAAFGAASTPAFGAAPGGFAFGGSAASSAAATQFGTPASSAGISFGAASTPAFGFGAASSAAATPPSFAGFGAAAASTPAAAAPAPAFGAAPAAGGFAFASAPAAAAPAPAFGAAPAAGGFAFGGASSAAAPASTAGFGAPASSAAASTGLNFAAASTPAAASGGGFSFGSTPAATFGAAAPAGGASAAGFAFASAPAAASSAAASAPAAGAAGFSFGGAPASTPAAASSAAAATPAAASTPAFGFGSAPAASAGSAPAASAPAAAAAATPVADLQAPSEIKGKPVDDIINEWNAELERRSRSFVKHAEALAQWDSSILSNRRALIELEEELRKMLETHQKGIHDALVGMEGEAERLYREEAPLLDDDSRERDRLYGRAEKVAGLLAHLGDQLKDAIADVNESTSATLGDTTTPLGKAVRILNNQLQALAQADAQIEDLSQRLLSNSTAVAAVDVAAEEPSGALRRAVQGLSWKMGHQRSLWSGAQSWSEASRPHEPPHHRLTRCLLNTPRPSTCESSAEAPVRGEQRSDQEPFSGNAMEWVLRKADESLDEIEDNPPEYVKTIYEVSNGPIGKTASATVTTAAKATVLVGANALKAAAPLGKWALQQGFKLAVGAVSTGLSAGSKGKNSKGK